ncbi:MAG: hypothetical protein QXI89_01645 [Candidatus Anstonellales archaeon]
MRKFRDIKEKYKKAEQKALEKIDKIADKLRKSKILKPLYERRKKLGPFIAYGDVLINTGILYLTLKNKLLGISSLYAYAYAKDAFRALQFFTNETKSPLAKYCMLYFSLNILSFGFYSLMPFESYLSLYFYIKTNRKADHRKEDYGKDNNDNI